MSGDGEISTGQVEIPATVYPGMFERELQATVRFGDKEITVIVSPTDVDLKGKSPSETGIRAKLKIWLVDADEKSFLFELPGEPLGVSRRFRIPKAELQQFLTPA